MKLVAYILPLMLLLAATLAHADPVTPTTLPATPVVNVATRPASISTTQQPSRPSLLRAEPLPMHVVPPDPHAGHIAKPTVAIAKDSCVTSECHTTVRSFKVVHGPVNVNTCEACHKLVDEKTHHFEPTRSKSQLCTFCHETMKPMDKFVHKPVQTGDCLGCHNPHGGNDRRMLFGNSISEMCGRCHDDKVFQKKFVHGPAALGACDACHQAHSSKFPKLVNAQGTDLCYNCHDQMKTQLVSAKFQHKVLADKGCGECHEIHASDYPKQLKMATQDLCVSCHKPVQQVMLTSAVKHSATTTGAGCINCHTPHGGARMKLMKAGMNGTCLTCHDKPITADGGRIIPSMAYVRGANQFRHGPLREGDCTGCHAPHGGPNAKLLAKAFPDTLYQSFDVTKYDLCFTCHDKNLVLQPTTTGLTQFRNGDKNLHFLHVNKEDKGRSCRACHEMHSSTQPRHLRETVPFGKWEMPISFAPTATGGSCRPGCHTEMRYDRQTPVQNKPVVAAGH